MNVSPYRKFAVAFVTALVATGIALQDGLTAQEKINVVVAFFGALGVYAVKNTPTQ